MARGVVDINIDLRDWYDYENKYRPAIRHHLSTAAAGLELDASNIIAATIDTIGGRVGFPEPYIRHIVEVSRYTPPSVIVSGDTLTVFFDFYELGTASDLPKAYHRHAKLKDGTTLDGPYSGQPLKYPKRMRLNVWETNTGLWEESWEEKVDIWGDRAPEWIFLAFGQPYDPSTPPTELIDEIEARLSKAAYVWCRSAVVAAALDAPLYKPRIGRQGQVWANPAEQAAAQPRNEGGQFARMY